jgi:hypothetical protein
MTRLPSLLVASALAILPLSAFAQQPTAPAKTAEPSGAMTTAPGNDKATTGMPSKTDTRSQASGMKSDAHGMNSTGHTKTPAAAKTADPSKS